MSSPQCRLINYFAAMDNYSIAEQFSLLSRLMDIHGENSFKSKGYASAAFALEKMEVEVSTLAPAALAGIRGIGSSTAAKVQELLQTGRLQALDELVARTPAGVLEMMNIKGLGPKKIYTLWKEEGIDTIEELKDACQEHRVAEIKGFGDKTEQKILEAIHFHQKNAGTFLYAQVEPFVVAFEQKLKAVCPQCRVEVTGDFRRQCEVVDKLEWVSTLSESEAAAFLKKEALPLLSTSDKLVETQTGDGLQLVLHLCSEAEFASVLLRTTGSESFLKAWYGLNFSTEGPDENSIFQGAGIHYIPPFLREDGEIIDEAKSKATFDVLDERDIRGLIHAHSNWSDGAHTLEEMALELIRQGFEYLVISDHSKAAFYANGLDEARIREQHQLIDELNVKLAPFKIYKSIECDILADGSMDFSDSILASFDLVIASIHSNLDMPQEKAMMRLMGAITNPYVTIMGHLTGRLLTRRKGYPIDHKAIIDACAANNVVIEINASPSRLDMDWRWIRYALDKGVLLSVNPDAHSFEDVHNLKYGVKVAQKGGLTAKDNLSSFTKEEFEAFIRARKNK
jgi:DNA polymerase (family 10)